MKIIAGAFFLAFSNKSLTREAPTPTNISTNSDPLIWKKGTSASPATAFAIKVLPVPGGPINNTPLGISAPISLNCFGRCRKSTTSSSSSLASFKPATSPKVFLVSSVSSAFLDLSSPKPIARLFIPFTCRVMK